MPVQPTSAEVGDSAVEGKATSASDTEVVSPAVNEAAVAPPVSAEVPVAAEGSPSTSSDADGDKSVAEESTAPRAAAVKKAAEKDEPPQVAAPASPAAPEPVSPAPVAAATAQKTQPAQDTQPAPAAASAEDKAQPAPATKPTKAAAPAAQQAPTKDTQPGPAAASAEDKAQPAPATKPVGDAAAVAQRPQPAPDAMPAAAADRKTLPSPDAQPAPAAAAAVHAPPTRGAQPAAAAAASAQKTEPALAARPAAATRTAPPARPSPGAQPGPAGRPRPAPQPGPATRPAQKAAASGGARWRAPGLDGVRALAVLAVLAFHESLPWIPGGFLGVDIFFVLSGFLITDLLAVGFRRHGNIGLGGFYQRRARRLLPALALMLITVTAAVTLLEPSQRASLRPALLGAVTYTSNWWQAFAHVSYFNRYGPPPVFEHLWSLAVEEQFYLIWPLILTAILVAIKRPGARAACAWAGALLSALLMLAIYTPGSDPSLVYYGTDTHASALMIGSALALTWPLAKVAATRGRTLRRLDIAGALGIVVLAWAMWHLSGPNSFVYPYGLVLAALASGALILAAAAPGKIGAMLSWRPLRWLGIRSYGIYLWHWPVIALTVGLAPRSASTAPDRIIDAIVPIGLAALSWHWLEQPILRNGFRAEFAQRFRLLALAPRAAFRTPGAGQVLLSTLAVVALTATAVYGLANPPSGPTLQQQIAAGAKFSSTTLPPPAPTGQPVPWFVIPGRDLPFRHPVRLAAKTRHRHKRSRVTGARVLAIGDSVMLASAPELAAAMPGIYINAQVSRAMIAGISIVDQLARSGRLRKVVIVGLGTNGPITSEQIRQLRDAIGDRWLVLVNTFVPRSWEHEVNTTIAAAAKKYANVLLVNWHAAIENHQNLLWSDDIHPQPVGGTLYAKVVRAVVLHALLHSPPPQPPRHPKTRVASRHVPPIAAPTRAG